MVRLVHVFKAAIMTNVNPQQSIFFGTQALTTLHWSRLSDTVGRKPPLLVGLLGLSLSMYFFGVSRTFWGLVVSRSVSGALNGNVGIMKSVMAELTDESNLARAYAYQPIAWSTGGTLGCVLHSCIPSRHLTEDFARRPLIGGTLSRPADRFPWLFGRSTFLKEYPYFLPCAIPATFSATAWLVTFCFLKEVRLSLSILFLSQFQYLIADIGICVVRFVLCAT